MIYNKQYHQATAPSYGSAVILQPNYGPIPDHYCRECRHYRPGGVCLAKRNYWGGLTGPLHSADKCSEFHLPTPDDDFFAPMPLAVSTTDKTTTKRRAPRGPYRRKEEIWELSKRTEKRCAQCGQLKPLDEYNTLKRRSTRHPDGHAEVCKACMEENKRLARIKAVATRNAHLAAQQPAEPKPRKLSWAGKRIKEMTADEFREYKRVNTANYHARHHSYPADPTPDTRVCVKCGRTLPLTDFHKCRCGYTHTCNECMSGSLRVAAKEFHKRKNHKAK